MYEEGQQGAAGPEVPVPGGRRTNNSFAYGRLTPQQAAQSASLTGIILLKVPSCQQAHARLRIVGSVMSIGSRALLVHFLPLDLGAAIAKHN